MADFDSMQRKFFMLGMSRMLRVCYRLANSMRTLFHRRKRVLLGGTNQHRRQCHEQNRR